MENEIAYLLYNELENPRCYTCRLADHYCEGCADIIIGNEFRTKYSLSFDHAYKIAEKIVKMMKENK